MAFLRLIFFSVLAIAACFFAFTLFVPTSTPDEFILPAGQQVFVSNPPIQTHLTQVQTRSLGKYTLNLNYSFEIGARVLGAKHYGADKESALSPVDLALGWGKMAQSHIIDRFDISQRGRFYYWFTKNFPIPRAEVVSSSANMHMIPANDAIEKALKSVSAGDNVYIKGYLVRATGPHGWYWNSSITRSDSGKGACEIIYVEDIKVQKNAD